MKYFISGLNRYEDKWVSKEYESEERAREVWKKVGECPQAKYKIYCLWTLGNNGERNELEKIKLG